MMPDNSHRAGVILALWWLLLVVAFQRIPFPLEETRQLAVAWEMWRDAQWLVPHLNGEPYGDHPPLLYWLIHLGWWLFGVDELWPFLVPVLFQAFGLLLAVRIARLLWPRKGIGTTTALLLSGLLLWAAMSTALMFEFLLSACTLLGIAGLALASAGDRRQGWVLFGLGLAAGLFAAGPVILVHLLPVALLAPWWQGDILPRKSWYAGLLLSILAGSGFALLWLLIADATTPTDYLRHVLNLQLIEPLIELFTGNKPIWWFVPLLPLIFFPWLLWPTAWQALASVSRTDRGVRFVLAWLLPSFLLLSLNTHKQPQDLLPLLPAFSLLLARGLLALPPRRERSVLPALGLLIWAGALGSLPIVAAWRGGGDWLTGVNPLWGLTIAALAVLVVITRGDRSQRVLLLSGTTLVMVIVMHLAIVRTLTPPYDVRPASESLSRLQGQAVPIAHLGSYNGQFHFTGRLPHALAELHSLGALQDWTRQHPDGWVVAYYERWPLPIDARPELEQPYRTGGLALWPARRLLDEPDLQYRLRY